MIKTYKYIKITVKMKGIRKMKIRICQEDREFIAKRVYRSDEYETIRIIEKIGLFRKRNLGYIVVNTTNHEDFDSVCCEALDRAIERDNYHRRDD